MVGKNVIAEVKCKVCGHKWFPRKPERPKWCPNCNSTNWGIGRKLPPRAQMLANAEKRRIEEYQRQQKEIIEDLRANGMWIDFPQEDIHKLEKISKALDFRHPELLAEEVVRAVLVRGKQDTLAWIAGHDIRDAAYISEDEALKKIAKLLDYNSPLRFGEELIRTALLKSEDELREFLSATKTTLPDSIEQELERDEKKVAREQRAKRTKKEAA